MEIPLRAMVAEEVDELIAIRHDLHAHPELGHEEHRTSNVVQRELARSGVEFRAGLARNRTGVLGHIPGDAERAIGLRADMDALPIHEKTNLPYASTNEGVMHACGHDGHTTVLIGAMRVLARVAKKQALPRPVTFLFQPAEEGGAGGRDMVEAGCLRGEVLGPPVEHMFGLHGWPQEHVGVVATRVGPMLAATDTFDITVKGTQAHAAFPHFGADPVVAAAALVGALQQVVARNTDPLDSAVVSVTRIDAGTAYNVIPDSARLGGTVRTLLPETRTMVLGRIREIADGVAAAHGCSAEVGLTEGYPVTANHPEAVQIVREVVGADQLQEMPPVMGGEDFAYYCGEVPSCFFVLGLMPHDETSMPGLHQPDFDFNDDALKVGVELFCRLALR